MSPFFRPTSTDRSIGKLNGGWSSIHPNGKPSPAMLCFRFSSSFTKKTKPVKSEHTLHGVILTTVLTAKYLGININNKLSWNNHTDTITKRATQSLNFVRRNFSSCSSSIRVQCYMSLFRPQLEYASSVWDNSVKRNITKIESVQRSAAQFVCRNYQRTSSVTAVLQSLGWESLQQRQARSRVLMLYRIRNSLVDIPAATFLQPCSTSLHQRL